MFRPPQLDNALRMGPALRWGIQGPNPPHTGDPTREPPGHHQHKLPAPRRKCGMPVQPATATATATARAGTATATAGRVTQQQVQYTQPLQQVRTATATVTQQQVRNTQPLQQVHTAAAALTQQQVHTAAGMPVLRLPQQQLQYTQPLLQQQVHQAQEPYPQHTQEQQRDGIREEEQAQVTPPEVTSVHPRNQVPLRQNPQQLHQLRHQVPRQLQHQGVQQPRWQQLGVHAQYKAPPLRQQVDSPEHGTEEPQQPQDLHSPGSTMKNEISQLFADVGRIEELRDAVFEESRHAKAFLRSREDREGDMLTSLDGMLRGLEETLKFYGAKLKAENEWQQVGIASIEAHLEEITLFSNSIRSSLKSFLKTGKCEMPPELKLSKRLEDMIVPEDLIAARRRESPPPLVNPESQLSSMESPGLSSPRGVASGTPVMPSVGAAACRGVASFGERAFMCGRAREEDDFTGPDPRHEQRSKSASPLRNRQQESDTHNSGNPPSLGPDL